MAQQRAPVPKRREALHAEVLSDGLYRTDKVKPLEAYLQEQVSQWRGVWGLAGLVDRLID
jgi:hypothetical protein